jgi:BlaI family transcriptional regulator, penicillinase repressor
MRVARITDTELSILEILWERGEATTREIAAVVYEEVTDPKMASAQKLLERLESKGFVQRDRSQRAHRFRAAVSRDDFLRSRLQSLADRLCGGAMTSLVMTLLDPKGLSQREVDELRTMISRLRPSKSAGQQTSD